MGESKYCQLYRCHQIWLIYFSSKSIHCAAMCSSNPLCEAYYFDSSKCYEGTAKCLMIAPLAAATERTVFIRENVLRKYESNDKWGLSTFCVTCYLWTDNNMPLFQVIISWRLAEVMTGMWSCILLRRINQSLIACRTSSNYQKPSILAPEQHWDRWETIPWPAGVKWAQELVTVTRPCQTNGRSLQISPTLMAVPDTLGTPN